MEGFDTGRVRGEERSRSEAREEEQAREEQGERSKDRCTSVGSRGD